MNNPKRYEIYAAKLPKMGTDIIHGVHPVLILKKSKNLQFVSVIPITSNIKEGITELILSQETGLRKPSVLLLEQIMPLDINCLKKRIGRLQIGQIKQLNNLLLKYISKTL